MAMDSQVIFFVKPEPPTGDANGDGYVNVNDLLLVLANWGG